MQLSLDFGASAEIAAWRKPLATCFGRLVDPPRRRPIGQLAKSLISSRTYDHVSEAAYNKLVRRWRSPRRLAAAPTPDVAEAIAAVTFAQDKAAQLIGTLRMIGRECPDYDLDFLGGWPEPEALSWLERHPGVGRKVAAATLNASTLRRRVFIVDSHVHRVLQRIGFIGGKATPKAASERVTATAAGLTADDLLELFAQLKRLGQTRCRFEAPDCSACPLSGCCRTALRR